MATIPEFGTLEFALANGRALLASDPQAAEEQAREILSKDPNSRPAMRLLAAALRQRGQSEGALDWEGRAIKAASDEPALVQTAQALSKQDARRAEELIRPYLARFPDDPAGLRLLADVADRAGYPEKALEYLGEALQSAPGYVSARLKSAQILHRQCDFRGAIAQLDRVLEFEPQHRSAESSKAATLVLVGEFVEAAALYGKLAKAVPSNPDLWISYAHVLTTLGRLDEAVAAYRRAIELRPAHGEAWWCISNMKVAKFDDRDVQAMEAALSANDVNDISRLQLHFALGKAFEDRSAYHKSFNHFVEANALRSAKSDYDPKVFHDLVDRSCDIFSKRFFEERRDWGAPDDDPIFIIGMPRSGSTLVEQILASHSKIEGTSELPYIPTMRAQLDVAHATDYPDTFTALSEAEVRAAGEQYLAQARENRKTDRPRFIDKLPNNWESLGMILTILPNAKIIDARRHPMACGFSNFKQHFARGQEFSYSLADMGAYYADYVRMMAHFDAIFPHRIKRVLNEALIEQPETEIRSLLDFLGVDFEETCLRFYETERPIRTPSSGQVRQPLSRKGLDAWRNFEPWLGDLKAALGPVLDHYPDVPKDFAQ